MSLCFVSRACFWCRYKAILSRFSFLHAFNRRIFGQCGCKCFIRAYGIPAIEARMFVLTHHARIPCSIPFFRREKQPANVMAASPASRTRTSAVWRAVDSAAGRDARVPVVFPLRSAASRTLGQPAWCAVRPVQLLVSSMVRRTAALKSAKRCFGSVVIYFGKLLTTTTDTHPKWPSVIAALIRRTKSGSVVIP